MPKRPTKTTNIKQKSKQCNDCKLLIELETNNNLDLLHDMMDLNDLYVICRENCTCELDCMMCEKSYNEDDNNKCGSCDRVFCNECYDKEIWPEKNGEERDDDYCHDCQYAEKTEE